MKSKLLLILPSTSQCAAAPCGSVSSKLPRPKGVWQGPLRRHQVEGCELGGMVQCLALPGLSQVTLGEISLARWESLYHLTVKVPSGSNYDFWYKSRALAERRKSPHWRNVHLLYHSGPRYHQSLLRSEQCPPLSLSSTFFSMLIPKRYLVTC